MRKYRVYGRKIPRVLYHWSPRSRRRSIRHDGLMIGRRSTDLAWKPPHICFSNSPARALMLCPHITAGTTLDLYEVFPMLRYKVYRLSRPRPDKGHGWLVPEWRIHNHIGKRRIYYIASRVMNRSRIPTV